MLAGFICPSRLCQLSALTCAARATPGGVDVLVTPVIAVLAKVFPSTAGSDGSNEHKPACFSCVIQPKNTLLIGLYLGVSYSKDDYHPQYHCCYRGKQVTSHSVYEVRKNALKNRLA